MSDQGLMKYTSKRAGRIHHDVYIYDITAAVTQSPLPLDDQSALVGFAAGAFTQALIDAHLGTSSEFTAAQYDATSMGADAQGIILDMGGQCEDVLFMAAKCYSAADGGTQVELGVKKSSTLTDSTLTTEVAVGANGNVGIKLDWTNSPDFDALTAGQVVIDLYWRAK